MRVGLMRTAEFVVPAAGDFVERDVLRGQFGRRGNCQAMAQAIRVADAPLQRLHAGHQHRFLEPGAAIPG